MIASIAMISSCKLADPAPYNELAQTEADVADLWKVNNYAKNQLADSTSFINFTVDFLTDGTVVVINDLDTSYGTWMTSYSDNPNFPVKIEMSIDDPALQVLNDSWDISFVNSRSMRLVNNYATGFEEIMLDRL